MRGVLWFALKLNKVGVFIGGVGVLCFVVVLLSWIFGERTFPPVFGDSPVSAGTYLWQIACWVVGGFALSRLALAVAWRATVRIGHVDDRLVEAMYGVKR